MGRVKQTDEKELMFCDFCIKTGVSAEDTNFVNGCPSMCMESVRSHEARNAHVLAANKHVNEQKPSEAPALKVKLSLNRVLFLKLQILFCTAHAINIKGRLHSDYAWLSELDVAKGLDIEECYRHYFTCEFSSTIADVQ